MRIIGGIAGGTLLKVPKGFDVRPTPDLVKQAIFNSLGNRVEDAVVLELFAGTGALSLESVSRGARKAVCIEKSGRHAAIIKQNVAASKLPPHQFEIRAQDVFTALSRLQQEGARFELILADPPFGEKNIGRRSTSLSQKLLDCEALPELLSPEAIFVCGHTKRDTLTVALPWEEVKVLKHGDSVMRLLKLNEG